jgi:hypothetical protein
LVGITVLVRTLRVNGQSAKARDLDRREWPETVPCASEVVLVAWNSSLRRRSKVTGTDGCFTSPVASAIPHLAGIS